MNCSTSCCIVSKTNMVSVKWIDFRFKWSPKCNPTEVKILTWYWFSFLKEEPLFYYVSLLRPVLWSQNNRLSINFLLFQCSVQVSCSKNFDVLIFMLTTAPEKDMWGITWYREKNRRLKALHLRQWSGWEEGSNK